MKYMTIIMYLLLGAASFTGALSGETEAQTAHIDIDNTNFNSVEVGLAELSPRGEVGGYAVPASGSSDPVYEPPVAILEFKVNSESIWRSGDYTINEGDSLVFRWDSRFSQLCNAVGQSGNFGFETGGDIEGTDSSIIEPAPGTSVDYWLSCKGIGDYEDTTDGDHSIITTATTVVPPTVNLYHRVNGVAPWSGGSPTIEEGDAISLYWMSTNADTCTATGSGASDGGFSTQTQTLGTDTTITEPTAGNSQLFRVRCDGPGGAAADTLTVTTNASSEPPLVASCSVSPTSIETGGQATWTATASGGNGTYTYQWSGTNNLSGTSRTITKSYSTTGTKTAQVIVTSGGVSTGSINCYNSLTVIDPGDETDPEPAPDVTLQVRNITKAGNWTSNDISIDPIDEIRLRWFSTNADSCAAVQPGASGFATEGLTGAPGSPVVDSTINEPAAGTSFTFRIACTGPGGTGRDSLIVSAGTGGAVTLDGDPPFVPVGEDATLTWDTTTNDPAACTLTGPGVNMSSLPSIIGSTDVPIFGESTFVLNCSGNTDDATIRVLPVVEET